ncbi:MAG: hypothetical protein VX473_06975, partial [Candidatus Thermoplasmatota archaeon]|nr:hypothetical protein [Candidatus Thermoplasmatota archaeon]
PFPLSAQQIKDSTKHFPKTGQREVRVLCSQTQRKDRPQVFIDSGLFLLPVKNGHYVIVKGEGYMEIPEITSPVVRFKPLNEFELKSQLVGNSEMQHLDVAHASGILEHFVEEGRLYLTIRGRKYTPEFSFKVGGITITQKSVQTEVDAGYEGNDVIVLVEGKNTKVKDTIIRQLYYPYRKWTKDTGKRTITMFFEKKGNEYMFWMYEFTDPKAYNSIRLVKSARYTIS